MKANGLLKWLVPAVLLGIVLIIGKSWVAAPDAEPAHDPENRMYEKESATLDASSRAGRQYYWVGYSATT